VYALLAVSLYGFWWGWDLNRRLRSLGQPARPSRALAEVTVGWLVAAVPLLAGWPWVAVATTVVPVVLSLHSVRETAGLLSAAQRDRGLPVTVTARAAMTIAALALIGCVAWSAMSLADVPGWMLAGMWPLVAMLLVGYLQAGANRLPTGSA
jgi:hypothetical protein